jgi:thiol-disulfide isomerase/thioredoxin
MSNRPSTRKTQSTSARVAKARHSESSVARWWIIGGVVLAISAALIIAMIVSAQNEDEGVSTAGFDTSGDAPPDLVTAQVKIEGQKLPEMPSAAPGQAPPADPGVGQVVPSMSGQKFNGEPITIASAGKPKVVMFLAHWCPHCQAEVPVIVDHLNGQLPTDVDLYAVSTGVDKSRPNYPPGAWLRKENWPVPTMVDDPQGSAAEAYGLSGFPFFVAVDASGKVVDRASGELTTQQFDALLATARTGMVS